MKPNPMIAKIEAECDGCVHWRALYSDGGKYGKACHYFQDEKKTRYSQDAWGKCTLKEGKK